MSYSLKVEVQSRTSSRAETASEAGPSLPRTASAASAVDLASDSIAFSAGNPRVEHLTGAVHLYRDVAPADAAARPAWTKPVRPWTYAARCSRMVSAAMQTADGASNATTIVL